MNLQGWCSSKPKQYSVQNQQSSDASFTLDKNSFPNATWQQLGFWCSLLSPRTANFTGTETSHTLTIHVLIPKQQSQPGGTENCSVLIYSMALFQVSRAAQVISTYFSLFFPCILPTTSDLASQCKATFYSALLVSRITDALGQVLIFAKKKHCYSCSFPRSRAVSQRGTYKICFCLFVWWGFQCQ